MTNIDEWKILDSYFLSHKYPFTSHHLDSYREFILRYIPETIKAYNPIQMIKYDNNQTKFKIDIFIGGKNGDEIYVDRPVIIEKENINVVTPNDARLLNLTYETHIYANILIEITYPINNNPDDNKTNIYELTDISIGSIPIMLHSDLCLLNGHNEDILRKMGECIYDAGGYFIIDGKEKVIVSQERITTNKLFITKLKDDDAFSYKGIIKCSGESGETMLLPRTIQFNLVRNPDLIKETEVPREYMDRKGAIVITIPRVEGNIPLFILFRALGIESDKDIFESIFGNDLNENEKIFFENYIRPSIYNNKYKVYTQNGAFKYLKTLVKYNTLDQVKFILTTDIFPNIINFENKGKYLGYIVRQFINTTIGIAPESDKDSYIYKRIDVSGYLLAELFQEAYMKLRNHIRDKMDARYNYDQWSQKTDYENFLNNDNVYKIIDNLIVAQTFNKSLKGMWGVIENDDPELGKVQDLSRISYIGFLSHLRRVNKDIDRSLKLVEPHRLHPHQFGIMCPFATPDGASVGYLKELAYLTKIASGSNPENIRECLNDIGVIKIENWGNIINRDITKVFINGNWFGITENPLFIIRLLRAYRRNGFINILISLSFNIRRNEIIILTETGRPCRPLIILNKEFKFSNDWFEMISGKKETEDIYYKNNYINPLTLEEYKNILSLTDLLEKIELTGAVIEYLDIEEEDSCLIAMTKKDINNYTTHLEIHPSTMLSAISGNIPLANHNQSARNVFHAAQTKQAIGIYATNFNKRFDTMAYVQYYPQKPIITTRISQYTASENMPNGVNVIVAIMSYTGFNQEDSIMINKKSIERGLFRLSYYKSVNAVEKEISVNERVIFGNPKEYLKKGIKINNIKHANYDYIDENGFIKEGIYIPSGQKVIIAGLINIRDVYKEVNRGVFKELIKEKEYTDVSLSTDSSLYGFIDKVYISNKTDNFNKICKIRFLKIKIPEFGDKHASRHGQKGVIGMIIPEENMPFSKNGIKPDIIINPHAIPSRMTIGHLVECIFSKLCCLKGTIGDGTIFLPLDDDKIYNELEKFNYEKYGNEILYNGFNGRQIECDIFFGPTYYFRLKHMVAEKINSRGYDRDKAELPKVSLTRQPTSGRRNGGGLRIGEMERDSLLSHGISSFIKESMMERSDKYKWAVCKRCGTLTSYNFKNNFSNCNNCKKDEIVFIETPYSFKLLSQELETMGIVMRINTDDINVELTDYDLDNLIDNNNDDDNDIINTKTINNTIINGGGFTYNKHFIKHNNIIGGSDKKNYDEDDDDDNREDDDNDNHHYNYKDDNGDDEGMNGGSEEDDIDDDDDGDDDDDYIEFYKEIKEEDNNNNNNNNNNQSQQQPYNNNGMNNQSQQQPYNNNGMYYQSQQQPYNNGMNNQSQQQPYNNNGMDYQSQQQPYNNNGMDYQSQQQPYNGGEYKEDVKIIKIV